MTIVPYVCADFHDKDGTVLYAVKAHQLGSMLFDVPESIRQDPLFDLLVADGSFRVPMDEKEKRQLENDPYAKAPGKQEETGSPAPAEEKPSGRKTAEKKP
ncbi:MAG: hypothetical protein K6E83_12455 [Clostridium sp.]|nr:hypothetical protein [Clostridium sp.]